MSNLIRRLSALDSPTVSDALDKLGIPGAAFGMAPMTVNRRIVGRAMTVKLGPPLPGLPKRHLGAGAIMAANEGDVIVLQHGRLDVSGWGGLLSRGAIAKGIAGIVVDGAFRDVDEARELGLPIYGRAAVPITARGRVAEHGFNEPIEVAGVSVKPHDLVLADGSGVVFIDAARADEIVAVAEDIYGREQLMARDIEAGKPVGEVLGANSEDVLTRTT